MVLFRPIGLALMLCAPAAIAAESPWVALGAQHPECTCRFKGESLGLGSQACIATPQGMRLAECVMEQNITSWRAGQQPCPIAQNRWFSPRQRG